jgi:hypothetical protein
LEHDKIQNVDILAAAAAGKLLLVDTLNLLVQSNPSTAGMNLMADTPGFVDTPEFEGILH